MTSKIQKVIILGAGGSIGPTILQALKPHFTLSIITRKSSTSILPSSEFPTFTVGDDYPALELLQAFQGQDAVVCCMSPWAMDKQFHIIDIAVQAGVKHFIPGEFGGDSTNAKAVEMIPPLKVRNDVVAYLRAQEGNGLSWTAVINGQILDWGLANGFLGFDMVERRARVFDGGKQFFSVSTLGLIGQAVANCLLDIEVVKNKYVYVASFTITQNDILDELKSVDEHSWTVENVLSEDVVRDAQETLRTGGNAKVAFRDLLLVQSYASGYGNDFRGREMNEALGLPTENLLDVVKNVNKPGASYL